MKVGKKQAEDDAWRHGEAMAEWAERLSSGVSNFTADMKAQGIHLGIGSPPRCPVDDEPWPCSHTRATEVKP